ncbi:MAG TPA: selenoneine biosynthesis selenosugar synthase SenB [Pyrinomonadaceae bacterium]|nr:selenoneine biosynthesis selenosugar synthase SenB [Pyrinomonadaceae bacterium]
MRIGIITPAPPGSNYGNRVTAVRWAKILRKLGHQVSIAEKYDQQPFGLLIALHARRSSPSITRWRRKNPDAPLVVALTGTDLYRDIQTKIRAKESLKLADRIVLLQPRALKELTLSLRKKTRVIYQSVEAKSVRTNRRAPRRVFDVCVIGHLRPVKDPFRAALASRLLPATSQIRILQIGRAMTKQMVEKARGEMKFNPRYRWLGEVSRARALRVLANSDLCVIPSRIEGGANVLSEAIVAAVPVLASRIDGNIGILGPDCPGLFGVGDTRELARLMKRAESDPKFLSRLKTRAKKLAPLFDPAREVRAWADLLDELY